MPDISTVWDSANYRCDWQQIGAVLLSGTDLSTAVLISLFTDRQAAPGDRLPDTSGNQRGWWADPEMGSRMWLLSRAKQTDETAGLAYDYIAEALQWLVDDGIVARFDIVVSWVRRSVLGAQVVAYSPSGAQLLNAAYAWNGFN